jgi:tricorn protease
MRTLILMGYILVTGSLAAGNVTLPRYPSISPDGSQIVFSWRGDLWKVSSTGGHATRLTSHPFNDLRSAFSADGKRLAFSSDRTGSENLFMMNVDGTSLRQVTHSDLPLALAGFGREADGTENLIFSARLEPEAFPGGRAFSVSVHGGAPARLFDAYGVSPSVSPDGSKILLTRGGSGWSRRGYRGSDNREQWLYNRNDKSYARITHWEGNDGRGKWIDNASFVYASDRQDNCVNLYRLDVGAAEEKAVRLTKFTDMDVEEFDVAANGKSLVFAMWDRLYTLDLSNPQAVPQGLEITADEDELDNYQIKPVDKTVTESALSPDGKTMAFVAYGELYVRGTEAKNPARRITSTSAREKSIAWSPDGARIFYTSDSTGVDGIYVARVKLTRDEVKKRVAELERQSASQPATGEAASTVAATEPSTRATTQPSEASRWHEALAFVTEPVVVEKSENRDPRPSPDGKWLSFRRGNGNLMLMELPAGQVRQLVAGWSPQLHWRWSPDSRRIAYCTEDGNNNADIWIIDADGAKPAVNVTRHPGNDVSPRFSADGKILAFLSERVNRESDVWMVYLDKDLETLTPAELEQYYKDASAAAKKREPLGTKKSATQPATAEAKEPKAKDKPPDLDDAYLRLRRVTSLPGDESELEITPGGDKYIFSATIGAEKALYTVEKDLGAPKRLANFANVQEISLNGEQLAIVEGGRGGIVKLPAGETQFLDLSDSIRVDLEKQSEQKFLEAARVVGQQFWDATLNNLDWEKLTQRYLALARQAHTADEFDHVAAKFIGELNGSHLGINAPDQDNPNAQSSGRLGALCRRVPEGYRVERVLEEGPAGHGAMRLLGGDIITAIDLEPLAENDTLEEKLIGKTGKETIVTVQRRGQELNLVITPISYQKYAELSYKDWRQRMNRQVSDWSNGKIGYIHIRGMDQNSLDVFERDLYAAADGKQGLIIDVRNNGGGWTADRLLASIMAPNHAYTVPRGMDPAKQRGYPNDRLFIARYTLPIDMLCNEKSFSNAEIISHAFKTLKRGTLIGQRTAGGVISTGGTVLIDGTTVRIPFRGWFLPDGTSEERNGAIPDVLISQTPEDESRDYDAQLKGAVDDLLKRAP